MTRTIFPMEVADISAFAKSLREQLDRLDSKPSHVEMLNVLSRAGGYRNFQHFRTVTKTAAIESFDIAAEREPPADETRVMRTIRVFDGEGRIVRWPKKRSQQELCLWFLWSKIPTRESFTERGISELLNTLHVFEDPALLRRDLFDLGLVTRRRDGSDYRRVERKPPPELSVLLKRISPRSVAA